MEWLLFAPISKATPSPKSTYYKTDLLLLLYVSFPSKLEPVVNPMTKKYPWVAYQYSGSSTKLSNSYSLNFN